MTTGSLEVFSDPKSVAIVGASADPSKWGYWIARGALRGAHRRTVNLVNARGAMIDGVASHHSLLDIPEPPELVVLTAPARTIPGVIDDALAMGVKGFLGITAHIDLANNEPGLERRLAQRIHEAGARIIGPNCLGLYDAGTQLELAWGSFVPGNIAIVSQSGQLGLELAGLAAHAGLGVSRFVSVGNQVDVTAADLLGGLVEHEATRAVILYLEEFGSGRELMDVMSRLAAAGKRTIVLTVGASEASRAAAKSHTGSMTSSVDVVAAACRRAGAILVETPVQAIDLAHLLVGSPLPQGRRVAVLSDSGGQGAIAADALARQGLTVPTLSEATSSTIATRLPDGAATANPIDLAGAGEQDLATYARIVSDLTTSGEVDAVVVSGYFGSYGADTPTLVERELEVAGALASSVESTGRTVIVHSMSHDSATVRELRARAVPSLHTIDAVARSLGQAVELRDAEQARETSELDIAPVISGPASTLPYLAGRDLVAAAGVRYPSARAFTTARDASSVAAEMQGPFVVKAGWLEHKTEVDGVRVNVADTDVEAVAAEMISRLGEGEYVLEEMDTRSSVAELIIGARRDDSFGPIVMVGFGGVQAEVYQDVALTLAPVGIDEARDMLTSLAGAPLLSGFRGRPPVDLDAVAEAVVAVSTVITQDGSILECEINPLRAGESGALAVDALVVRATSSTNPSGLGKDLP